MEDTANVFEEYGADPRILEEYDCVPLRARIVRDVVKVRTSVGTRAFKKVLLSEERLEYVHRSLEYVASRGVTNVPRMIRNRFGDPYVVHPSGLYYMTTWIPGREADFRKLTELVAGARLLAAWHDAAHRFAPDGVRPPPVKAIQERIAVAVQDFENARKAALEMENPSPFQRLLLACANEVQERCDHALAAFAECGLVQAEQTARAEGRICHGNFHKQNVRFDGESLAILNYEGVHPGLPVTDFSFFCHRYMPSFEWDPGVFLQVVEAYQSVRGYHPDELTHLSALLSVPLRTLQVVSWYHRGTKDWDEEDYLDYLEGCLGLEELRDEARTSMRSRRSGGPISTTGLNKQEPSSGSEWQVATFAIHSEPEPAVDTEDSHLDDVPMDVEVQLTDSPITMQVKDVKDGILVVRSPKDSSRLNGRRRRKRRRDSQAFQPEQPGLRLWSTNEHRREDDKE